jgi:hypothetical protein
MSDKDHSMGDRGWHGTPGMAPERGWIASKEPVRLRNQAAIGRIHAQTD